MAISNRRLTTRYTLQLFLAATLTLILQVALQFGAADEVAKDLPAVPLQTFEDPPQPLNNPRDEAEQDRVDAAAFFLAARIHDQKDEHAKSIRLYQRAYRYDNHNVEALNRTIQLAFHLKQYTVAARYAVLLVPHDASDPVDVLQAFLYLKESKKNDEALELYEQAVRTQRPDGHKPAWVALQKLVGQAYLQAGKYTEAAEAFAFVDEVLRNADSYGYNKKDVEKMRGDTEALYLVMAEAFLKAKRLEKAQEVFELLEKKSPDLGRSLINEARLHAAAKRRDKAHESLQGYFDGGFSDHGDRPYELLGELLSKEKKQDELIPRLVKLHETDQDNAALAYFLAAQYLEQDQLEKAQKLIEAHVEEHPDGRSYRALARIYRERKQAQPLLKIAGAMADRIGTLGALGKQLEAIANDAEFRKELVELAEQKLKDAPDDLNYGQRLAVAQIAATAKDFETAGRFYEAAVMEDDQRKAAVFESWGMALMSDEKYEAAAEILQRAVDEKLAPEGNPIFDYYLAGSLAMADKFDEALVAARRAAKIGKDTVEFQNRVAWVLYRADRRKQAIEEYTKMLETFDKKRDGAIRDLMRETRLTLSHLQLQEGDVDRAVELLEQVLDEFPDDVGARNDLGYLWADEGKHLKRALSMIQAAIASEPDNAAYLDSLGWVLFRLQRYDEAVKQLEQAVEAVGDEADGVILDHLGDAYQKVGKIEKATEFWTRTVTAYERDKDEKSAKKTRAKLDKQKAK